MIRLIIVCLLLVGCGGTEIDSDTQEAVIKTAEAQVERVTNYRTRMRKNVTQVERLSELGYDTTPNHIGVEIKDIIMQMAERIAKLEND